MTPQLKKQIIRTLCISYVIGHLVVAFFSVRSWPFTDYPMFSDPVHKGDNIFVYRYEALLIDGTRRPLERSFATGHGIGELNVTQLYVAGDLTKFKSILSTWLKNQPPDAGILGVVLSKVTANQPSPESPEFKTEQQDVLILTKEDLQ